MGPEGQPWGSWTDQWMDGCLGGREITLFYRTRSPIGVLPKKCHVPTDPEDQSVAKRDHRASDSFALHFKLLSRYFLRLFTR